MSAVILAQTKTALAVNLTASFLAAGGTGPYLYGVRDGGAGGLIDPSSGLYLAPSRVQSDPARLYDTIIARDIFGVQATSTILVGTPLLLFCEILERELELSPGRVYLWDQKINQPTDSGLYVAVSVPTCKPFSNNIREGFLGGDTAEQYTNFTALLDIDIISRDSSARDRKEEVVMALNSTYAQQQQVANSFYIGKLPPGSRFLNISMVDGAAIPYRYRISINMQYAVFKTKPIDYFDTFSDVALTTNP